MDDLHSSTMIGLGDDEGDAFTPSTTLKPLPPPVTPAKGMPKTVRIMLNDDENIPPTGQPMGYNGRTYIVVPGVPVDVPQGLIDILDDAVIKRPVVDPQTKKVIGYRDVLRFGYRRL